MKNYKVFALTIFALSSCLYFGCSKDEPGVNADPAFEEDAYTFNLPEDATSGNEVGMVSATDAESVELTYTLSGTGADNFAISGTDVASGEAVPVTVAEDADLDFETAISYTLEVQVSDGVNTVATDLTINLTDVNEYTPAFVSKSYAFDVAEDAVSGAEAGTVEATDDDGTAALEYSITTDQMEFDIGANTGTVTVVADLDFETTTSYTLEVQASDGVNMAKVDVTITITNINEFMPEFANASPYAFNVAVGAAVRTVVGKVSATDEDAEAMLTYSLSGTGAANFAISSTPVVSGEEVPVTVAAGADLSSIVSPATITVTVSDGSSMAEAEVRISLDGSPPVFANTPYHFNLALSAADDTTVGRVYATDEDAGAMLMYSLSGTGAAHFSIINTPVASGEAVPVTVASGANLPSLTSPVTLVVTVDDGSNTATANMSITIMAGNVAPVFDKVTYIFEVAEGAVSGAVVGTISAIDANAGDLLTYTISGTGAAHFAISNESMASGEIVPLTVAPGADLPSLGGSVTLVVTATDGGALTATANMEIAINAGNVAPVFGETAYTFAINEDAMSGTIVGAVSATDSDAGDLLTYTISGEGAGNFAISNTPVPSGMAVQVTVAATAALDFETTPSYTLNMQASDDATPSLMATAKITINVGDVDESNAPVFAGTPYTFNIAENSPANTEVGTVVATSASGTTLAYRMTTPQTDFGIGAGTGVITVASASLDFETTASYQLNIEASDGTNTATADVTINVDNVNEAPAFSGTPYTFNVDENSDASTLVGMVSATDVDAGTTLKYSIMTTQTDFDIDSGTGEMTVASATLDFETTPSYTLEVQASDGASPALTATADVTINVNDLNDEAPAFGETAYTFEIGGANALSGDEVGTVAATDADAGATLEYSITNTQTEFDIDANTGIITVSDAATFDRNTLSTYTLMVQVDDDTNTAMANVTITIVEADYDADNDGLIDIKTLEQLNAMRWDLDGDGMPDSNTADYEAAFPDAATFAPTPTGYELLRDLDFDEDDSYAGMEADQDWSEAQGTTSGGWDPIGDFTSVADNTPYTAAFEGNDYTLSNLYINRDASGGVGLFATLSATSTMSGVGLVDVNIEGSNSYVGGLVGFTRATITACHATGTVSAFIFGGGLVGYQFGGSIMACYASVAVTGIDIPGANGIGGLVGISVDGGNIIASYATGNVVANMSNQVGGLVGVNSVGSNIMACYATGAVSGLDQVGGLLGENEASSTVTACYATGAVTGTSLPRTGGLIGDNNATATASYFNTATTTQTDATQGKTTSELKTPTVYDDNTDATDDSSIYETWNVDIDNADGDDVTTTGTDDPWDFGTSSQYPVLKVDFDRDGDTADDITRQRQ